MKFFTVFIIAIVFVFTGFIMMDDTGCKLPDDEQTVNETLSNAAEFFKKKYGLHPVAKNIAMPGGNLKLMGLNFQMSQPMQRKEIRKLLLEMSGEFLGTINSNEKNESNV